MFVLLFEHSKSSQSWSKSLLLRNLKKTSKISIKCQNEKEKTSQNSPLITFSTLSGQLFRKWKKVIEKSEKNHKSWDLKNKSEYFDKFKYEFETISNAYRYSRICKKLVDCFDFEISPIVSVVSFDPSKTREMLRIFFYIERISSTKIGSTLKVSFKLNT